MRPPPRRRKSVLLALDWYVHEINVGVAKYAHDAGWILQDSSAHTHSIPLGWNGDGIITQITSLCAPIMQYIEQSNLPVVILDNHFPEMRYPRVLADNIEIGRLAAEELLSAGHEHFAFYALELNAPVVKERMKGFRDHILAAGRNFSLLDYGPHWNRPNALQLALPWLGRELKKLPKPLGAMAQHDGDSNIIVQACLEAGIKVPDEVAVIGVDNDPIYSELGPIPLTSVISNRELMGYKGAELLDGLMRGIAPPSNPILIRPGGIKIRQSSSMLATNDRALRRALEFINEHLSESMQIDDIVSFAGASRRSLYLKFSRVLGRSIQQEITRRRINRAKVFLADEKLKLEYIAHECGFEDASRFSKVFKMVEGVSPSTLRQRSRVTNQD